MTIWPGNFKSNDVVHGPEGFLGVVPVWRPREWGMPTTPLVPVIACGAPHAFQFIRWFEHTVLAHGSHRDLPFSHE